MMIKSSLSLSAILPSLEVTQEGNTLRAFYSDGIARNFQVAGPFDIDDLTDEDCEDKQFGSSYSSPQSNRYNTVFEKQVDADDNEKYYCFMVEADDAGSRIGYEDFQVSLIPELEPDPEPELPSDTTAPTITIRYSPAVTSGSTAGRRSAQLVASANEEVNGWSYRSPSNFNNCGEDIFHHLNPTPTGSSKTVILTDTNANGKYYCFKSQDAAGNWGFVVKQVSADAVRDTGKLVISSLPTEIIHTKWFLGQMSLLSGVYNTPSLRRNVLA